MSRLDYGNGYRAGMQKMRDLAQARIEKAEGWPHALSDKESSDG